MDEPIKFGAALKDLRRAKGLTQEGLAQAAELSVATITRLERNDLAGLHLKTFCRVVTALDADPCLLIILACRAAA